MSTPFLYSEQFIEILKAKLDPKTNLNDLIKESIQDGNGNKYFTLNIPNSKDGDLLPELTRGLLEIGDFYPAIIKVANFGLQAISSPDWMLNKVSDHIAVLSLYKAYLEEVSVQRVRQSCFKQEETTQETTPKTEPNFNEWNSKEDEENFKHLQSPEEPSTKSV